MSVGEIDGADFGVDSRYVSKEDMLSDGKALMEARLERMKNVSGEQILWARLLQLKLQMEAYLTDQADIDYKSFTDFLKMYIDTLYSKRSNFAKDLDITPVSLSQVLNNHREPKAEFLQRLMIHSEEVYRNVCPFKKETWFRVYYHEKICNAMSDQDHWMHEEEKHVNISEPLQIYGKLLGK